MHKIKKIAPKVLYIILLVIFIAVMVFNLLGDTIRDFMDPQHRKTAPGGQGWLRKRKETPDGEVQELSGFHEQDKEREE